MSKQTKTWLLGLVVIILIGVVAWQISTFNTVPASQSATVVNSTAANVMISASSLALINRDVANLDSQMSLSVNELSTINAASSQAQVSAVAKHLITVASLVMKLNSEFAYTIPKSNLPTFQPMLADINQQMANAQIQFGAITNTQKAPTIAQSVADLQVAQNYLVAARKDIGNVVQGL